MNTGAYLNCFVSVKLAFSYPLRNDNGALFGDSARLIGESIFSGLVSGPKVLFISFFVFLSWGVYVSSYISYFVLLKLTSFFFLIFNGDNPAAWSRANSERPKFF